METVRSIDIIRGRKRITFDSGWQVWLMKNDAAAFGLEEGTEVNRDEFRKHILKTQYPPALNKAVVMLEQRNRSRKEIESGLEHSHYDKEVIEIVLFKLEKEKILNDAEFAAQWVQSRMRKYGSTRIGAELRQKGIDGETAQYVLETLSEDEQLEHAVDFARKKIATRQEKEDKRKLIQRISNALVRRGYSWEIATRAVRLAMEESEDD